MKNFLFSFSLRSLSSLCEDEGWGKRKRTLLKNTECVLHSDQWFRDLHDRAKNLMAFHSKITVFPAKTLLHCICTEAIDYPGIQKPFSL